MIYLNSNSTVSNPDIGFAFNYNDGVYRHGGFFRDASDNGTFKVFDNYSPEPDANIFIDTADASFRLANIAATTFFGNVTGTVGTLGNFTTANLAEGINLYYTNARVLSALTGNVTIGNLVTGTSVSNSYVTAGNVNAGNIIASGIAVFGSGGGGSIAGANLISANNIQSINWLGLYTSNVIEGINQYFTNARVFANVIGFLPSLAGSGIQIQANGQINANAQTLSLATLAPFLTTSNVSEGSNLYYTNARVLSALTGNLVVGNITAGNIITTGTAVFGSGGGGSIVGANLVSATNIQANSWLGLYSANVIESNTALFYTNTRVISAVLPYLTTSNVSEGSNLYYTNARVISAVLPYLTTSNVAEGSNLYYTNARVLSALTGNVTIGNLTVNTSTANSYATAGNINAGNVLTTGLVLGSAIGGSLTGANLVSTTNIQANSWLGLYTSNVIESNTALFYTNARVNSNVIAFLPSLAGQNITIAANGQINATTQTVSIGAVSQFLTTANVTESNSNLYYTNARVLSALTGNLVVGNLVTGTLVTGTSVSNSYVTAGNVNAGNVIATTLVLGSATGGSVTGANLLSANNIQGINWIGLYSANVIENTNLYFTNARVFANVIGFLPSLAGSGIQIDANGQISANISGTSITSTSNVSEGSNLYYTNARVLSALTGNITIGNLVTGTSVSNSYVTAGNITAGNVIATTLVVGSATGGSVTGANLLSANNIQGINWIGLYTANVIETASNLYFTNARVVSALSTDATIVIEANGQIRSNTSAGTVSLDGLTTANLAEGGANLYFSNARVLSALTDNVIIGNLIVNTSTANSYTTTGNIIAGNLIANGLIIRNITVQDSALTGSTSANNIVADSITANTWSGLYTANVIESDSNLYYTNARVLANLAISNVIIGNLVTDTSVANSYTTTGNIIASSVIAGNVFANALILRSVTVLGTGIYRPYIATFKGNSQVTTLNLPVTPANNNYVTVIINGVTQLSNAYTLSGNVITLSGAPATNADIDVRIVEVEQTVTKDFNSRLFYGNSVANTTLISSNFTDSSILVFENGVAQVPGVDYSVNKGLLRFTTPPGTGVIVEIRELPTLFSTGTYLGGKNTEILANGQINSNITVGQNLTISANGQINAIVQEQIHPFLLSLL